MQVLQYQQTNYSKINILSDFDNFDEFKLFDSESNENENQKRNHLYNFFFDKLTPYIDIFNWAQYENIMIPFKFDQETQNKLDVFFGKNTINVNKLMPIKFINTNYVNTNLSLINIDIIKMAYINTLKANCVCSLRDEYIDENVQNVISDILTIILSENEINRSIQQIMCENDYNVYLINSKNKQHVYINNLHNKNTISFISSNNMSLTLMTNAEQIVMIFEHQKSLIYKFHTYNATFIINSLSPETFKITCKNPFLLTNNFYVNMINHDKISFYCKNTLDNGLLIFNKTKLIYTSIVTGNIINQHSYIIWTIKTNKFTSIAFYDGHNYANNNTQFQTALYNKKTHHINFYNVNLKKIDIVYMLHNPIEYLKTKSIHIKSINFAKINAKFNEIYNSNPNAKSLYIYNAYINCYSNGMCTYMVKNYNSDFKINCENFTFDVLFDFNNKNLSNDDFTVLSYANHYLYLKLSKSIHTDNLEYLYDKINFISGPSNLSYYNINDDKTITKHISNSCALNKSRIKEYKEKNFYYKFSNNVMKIYSKNCHYKMTNNNDHYMHKIVGQNMFVDNQLSDLFDKLSEFNDKNTHVDKVISDLLDYKSEIEFKTMFYEQNFKTICFASNQNIYIGDESATFDKRFNCLNHVKNLMILKTDPDIISKICDINNFEIIDNSDGLDNSFSIDEFNMGYIGENWVFVKSYDRHNKNFITIHDINKLDQKMRDEFMISQLPHYLTSNTEIGKFDFVKLTGLNKEYFYHMCIDVLGNDLIMQNSNHFIIVCGFYDIINWIGGFFTNTNTVSHKTTITSDGVNSTVEHNNNEIFRQNNGVIVKNDMKIGILEEFPKTVWKVAKIKGTNTKCIIKLLLPDDTIFIRPFSCTNWNGHLYTGKSRCNMAYVLAIQEYSFDREVSLTNVIAESAYCDNEIKLDYIVDTFVMPQYFDDNPQNECSYGIHVYEERHHIVTMTGDDCVKPIEILRKILPTERNNLINKKRYPDLLN